MTRGCVLACCGAGPAKKAICCGMRLCETHAESGAAHDCPEQKRLLEIASDPAKRKAWLDANSGEERTTVAVIVELNRDPDLTAWRTKRRQGAKSSDDNDGVLDVSGIAAPDGRAFFVETKNNHKPSCVCPACKRQRDFAMRVRGAGGVAIENCRDEKKIVDEVKLELARVRAKTGAAA